MFFLIELPTTRVPQVRSCPPRGWSGAGVGVGMLRGRRGGSWLLDCLVSRFLGFLVFAFLIFGLFGFKVSWWQSFLVQRFKVSMIPHYQISMSCFQEDIDPILKIFKKFQDGSSWFPGAPLLQHFRFCRFPKMFRYIRQTFIMANLKKCWYKR